MAIRKYKPTTPGRRASSVSEFEEITRSTPEKSLLDSKRREIRSGEDFRQGYRCAEPYKTEHGG